MEVPDRVLTISKAEGATRHVEEAIRALQRGEFDLVVTLAGAAEGMFDLPGLHLHYWTYIHARAREEGFDRRELSNTLNAARTWLKHPVPEQGETLTLKRHEAVQMIMRAMSKLNTWTPPMDEFKAWLDENYDEVFGGGCSK